jgi:hypothetical protein
MSHRGKEEYGEKLRGGTVGKPRYMERLGYQMTHLKWKHLGKRRKKRTKVKTK